MIRGEKIKGDKPMPTIYGIKEEERNKKQLVRLNLAINQYSSSQTAANWNTIRAFFATNFKTHTPDGQTLTGTAATQIIQDTVHGNTNYHEELVACMVQGNAAAGFYMHSGTHNANGAVFNRQAAVRVHFDLNGKQVESWLYNDPD
jgi:hypothetical protein